MADPPPPPDEEEFVPQGTIPTGTSAKKYCVDEFLRQTSEKDHGQGKFELESNRMLEVNLNGKVWIKWGSMIAYAGGIKFKKAGISDKGLGKVFKEKFTGEGMTLTKAEGSGQLYLADQGKSISVIELGGSSLFVNGNDVLAFEDTVKWDVKMIRSAGMAAGGLFNVHLSGHGMIAVTTHGQPLTLRTSHDRPVMTDPNATVAWSATLSPSIKTDISLGTLFGKTSGETIQLMFKGDGFVVVQPYEEIVPVQPR